VREPGEENEQECTPSTREGHLRSGAAHDRFEDQSLFESYTFSGEVEGQPSWLAPLMQIERRNPLLHQFLQKKMKY